MGHRISVLHLSGSREGAKEAFVRDVIRAGRDPSCELRFHRDHDLDASATHAEIRRSEGGYKILDLGSTNGTYVNDQQVVEARLSTGDVIEFGRGGPKVRVTITRVYRPRAGLIAVGLALILVTVIVVGLAKLGGKGPSETTPAAAPLEGGRTLVAVQSRAWYTTQSSVEEIVERWGTGVLISADGLALVPKHIVRPWKFDPKAAAMMQHYGDRVRTSVAVWVEGVAYRREGIVDLDAAYSTENDRLEILEAPDALEAAEKEVEFAAGGKSVIETVRLHTLGPHDTALLDLSGQRFSAHSLQAMARLPEGAENLRIIGQRSSSPPPDRLEPSGSPRRVLKVFEDSFELEVGPRYWSGAVILWKERPVGIYSEILGQCIPIDSIRDALLANPEIRERYAGVLLPPEAGK